MCLMKKMSLGFLFLKGISPCVDAQAGDHFPYFYTPENLTWWEKVRVEGRPFSYLWPRIAGHAQKFSLKKWSTSPEEKIYFEKQKEIILSLENMKEDAHEASLGFVGDIMWIRKDWDSFLSSEVKSFLEEHDGIYGNLETPLSRSQKVPSLLPVNFVFNSPPELIWSFRRGNGKNLLEGVSIINNHALDQGDLGLQETMAFLEEENISYSGAQKSQEDKKYVIKNINGFKIGFWAGGYGLNGLKDQQSKISLNIVQGLAPDHLMNPDVSSIVQALKDMDHEGVDFKIVSLHWGFEYEYYPQPSHMIAARKIAQAGADVILGHHPHVQQPLEVLFFNNEHKKMNLSLQQKIEEMNVNLTDDRGIPRKTLVMYSLGNFLTTMNTFLCQLGVVRSLNLKRNEEGYVDWFLQKPYFVVNQIVHPELKKHQLVSWETYLSSLCFGEKCSLETLKEFNDVFNL